MAQISKKIGAFDGSAHATNSEFRRVRPAIGGGEGWIRTSVRLRGQIYSLLPLTTRPPLQGRQPAAVRVQGGGGVRAGGANGEPRGRCQLRASRSPAPRTGLVVAARRHLARSNFDPAPGRLEIGAGEGNRTLVVSLEGFCSTIELHPPGAMAHCHLVERGVNSLADRPRQRLGSPKHPPDLLVAESARGASAFLLGTARAVDFNKRIPRIGGVLDPGQVLGSQLKADNRRPDPSALLIW
jgi:hypothetical protein